MVMIVVSSAAVSGERSRICRAAKAFARWKASAVSFCHGRRSCTNQKARLSATRASNRTARCNAYGKTSVAYGTVCPSKASARPCCGAHTWRSPTVSIIHECESDILLLTILYHARYNAFIRDGECVRRQRISGLIVKDVHRESW
jgi:hypothetical protein